MRWTAGQLVLVLALTLSAAGAAEKEQHVAPPEPAVYPAPRAMDALLLDVAAAGKHFVAVGAYGNILVSENGADWRQVRSPVSVMLNRLAFADVGHGWAVGHDGLILHTDDGGENWDIQFRDISGRQAFYDIYADSTERAIAVGSGRAVLTDDGGKQWQPLSGPLFSLNWNFNAINRLADGCLMIAGERGVLARSCDNGLSWQQIRTPYIGSYYGVLPYGAHGAVVFGMRGHIYVAENVQALSTVDPRQWDPYTAETVVDSKALSAMGWRSVPTPVDQSLYDGVIDASGYGVFAGVGGNVIVGNLKAGAMRRVEHPGGQPISAFVRRDGQLLTAGRGGIGHIALHPVTSQNARR